MNINKFEEIVKSVFERHRPETDHDLLWENIEPHLKKKKKRRAFILLFWGLALGLLFLFFWQSGVTPKVSSAPGENNTASPVENAAQPGEKVSVSGANTTDDPHINIQSDDKRPALSNPTSGYLQAPGRKSMAAFSVVPAHEADKRASERPIETAAGGVKKEGTPNDFERNPLKLMLQLFRPMFRQ